MKGRIILLIQTAVILALAFHSPLTAAGTEQTHLTDIVKTKQLLLVKATRHIDEILPNWMARIEDYKAAMADCMARAHQLRFLIAVSESNPFEVRMYFKQAAELRDGLVKKIRALRKIAREIRINLSIVNSAREDLHYIAQTAVSTKQKQNAMALLKELERFEAVQLKITKPLQEVLAQSDEIEKLNAKWEKELREETAMVWSVYFTKPLGVLFDRDVLVTLPLACSVWVEVIGPTLDSKLPDTPVEWGQSACAFLAAGLIFFLLFRWAMGRIGARSEGNQAQWDGMRRSLSPFIFLFAGFQTAAIIGVFPENIIFSRLAVIFGFMAAISLAWSLRNLEIRSGLSSPLYPLFCLFVAGIMAQMFNMPLLLLGVLWPLGTGIMMFFLWRTSYRYKDPAPRKLARFCFWSGFPIIALSLAGFTFPAVEAFLTLFICSILFQIASAVSDLIRRGLARLQDKDNSLFYSVAVSLSIPIIWFLAIGVFLLLLADQFGEAGILDLVSKIRFTWQDLQIGLFQIIAIPALFFMVKPVVAVLKGGLERLGRKSNWDRAVIMPLETVVVYGIWALYGLVLLYMVGVRLGSIMVLAGGLSVGIGFGLQHIINNFVSGLILLFGRSVRPGDVIEHELVMGEVEKVTIRSTLVRTRDDTTMLIPNSNLVSMPFLNMSRGNRAVRLVVAVGADYSSDTSLAQRLLLEAAREHPDVLKHPAPRVRFEDFKDSYLDFRVKFWVNFDGSRRVASDLRFAILKKFRENGVEIAFPQMDLHIKDMPKT